MRNIVRLQHFRVLGVLMAHISKLADANLSLLKLRITNQAVLPNSGRAGRDLAARAAGLADRRVIELAFSRPVDEAVPFVPVEYQDPPGRIAGQYTWRNTASRPAPRLRAERISAGLRSAISAVCTEMNTYGVTSTA